MSHFYFLDYTISGILSRVFYIVSRFLGGVLRFWVTIVSRLLRFGFFLFDIYYIMRVWAVVCFGLCVVSCSDFRGCCGVLWGLKIVIVLHFRGILWDNVVHE